MFVTRCSEHVNKVLEETWMQDEISQCSHWNNTVDRWRETDNH